MNSKNKQEIIEWRRDKVQLLSSKGYSQRDIAKEIQVSLGTVNKDISFLRQQSKENIKKYVDEKLPEEYEKCLIGISSILKESWELSNTAKEDKKLKIQALSLAKECYSQKLDLLTNSGVISDVMQFVENSKNKIIVNSREIKKEEKKENNSQRVEKNISIKSEEGSTFNNTF
ncbi:MAG: hypothetical protein ACPKPY_09480 [Nitrososphaeraceae archaeon]